MSPTGSGAMGSGYGRHSAAQHAGLRAAGGMLDRALEAVPVPADGHAFRVADLGCASGTNAMEPMARTVAGVRARRPGTPVWVTHTDIPANDFGALFATLAGPSSYTRTPDVFGCAQARSFYEPLFPPGELHLAWCSIAVHWLSRVPLPIDGHIYGSRATGAARTGLRRQSAEDWAAFLGHRAAELAPGGQLVVVGGAATDDGLSGAEGLFDLAVDELDDLVARGALTREQLAVMTVPTWNRTTAEFVDPVVSGPFRDRFRLEEREFVVLDDPMWVRYDADGDLDAYASEVTASFMAAFGPSLFAGPAAVGPDVAQRFTDGLTTRVRNRPEHGVARWRIQLLRATRL
ncbi:hypothetical protein JCM4814A_86380 [Streptomyces phaeofaciens JCM 4814]|uniref:SAM dependent carboxyl methyltransferase n=1 Tax=Streptomyces phaeofaciens TaxID=68254 RepID=A0A918LSZ2_9ACTN|nr:hypothetical protein [Streptomyces phaeofaciens]GGT44935.1 hypothetical protein GCM10010226_21960 [Streptomyces phaeofaciens]